MYAETWLDWPDVWFAHAIHLSNAAVKRIGETGTGVAHCPSSNARIGAGIARSAICARPACRWASGWTARPATRPAACSEEVRHALLFARAKGGPSAYRPGRRWNGHWTDAAVLGRTATSAHLSRASKPTWRSGGSTAWRTPTSPTRWRPGPRAPRRHWTSYGRRRPVVENDHVLGGDEDAQARAHPRPQSPTPKGRPT